MSSITGAVSDLTLIDNTDLLERKYEALLEMTGRPLRLVTGVRERECAEPFRAWLDEHGAPGPKSWSARNTPD